MSDTIEEMRAYTAYYLASMADCASPDTLESEGAQFLSSVASSFWERWDYGSFDDGSDDGDTIHEIADNAPSVYSFTLWTTFVDLGGYREDRPDYADEWPEDMDRIASMVLFCIAERLCHALLDAAREAAEEADEDPDGTYTEDDQGNWHRVDMVPAEAVLTVKVSDPILDLIAEHEAVEATPVDPLRPGMPGDETSAFMARMDAVNAEEFGRVKRRRWVRAAWSLVASLAVGVAVGQLVLWVVTR